MNIYFLSGLGADESVFRKLDVPDGFKMVHIPWQPVKGTESLRVYAGKMAAHIDRTKPFILAGLSFGGLVATEICKLVPAEKLILFSTVRTRYELPVIYRFAGRLRLNKILPAALLPLMKPFLTWFFGPLDKESRLLVADYIKHTDSVMLRWALGQISNWQNKEQFKPDTHIHGMKDRALPFHLTNAEYSIKAGGHFCVFTHANEVNDILKKELAGFL